MRGHSRCAFKEFSFGYCSSEGLDRSRGPFRPSRQPLEPQDAAVHLRPPQSDPHHRRPRNDPRPAAGQEVPARRSPSQGSLVLFVGTKRQAADAVEQRGRRCGMPYVSDRWLGGTLTNFRTIRSRLGRLEELEDIRSTRRDRHVLEEDAVGAEPRVPQDVSAT